MKKYKIVINIIGYLMLLLSFVFIFLYLRKIDFTSFLTTLQPAVLFILIPQALLYSAIVIVLALNFSLIIKTLTAETKVNLFIIPDYLKSNINKYLPTNLFHFAGRHVLLYEQGYANKIVLTGNITEFFFLVLVAVLFLAAGLGSRLISIPYRVFEMIAINRIFFIILAVILLIAGIIILIKIKIKKILEQIRTYLVKFIPGASFKLSLLYAGFFLITGLILYWLLVSLSGTPFSVRNLFYTVTAFSTCWLIGFISPGVPGGIGVREALLLLFFTGQYGEATAFSAALLLRLVTVCGDILVFIYAFLIKRILIKIRIKK